MLSSRRALSVNPAVPHWVAAGIIAVALVAGALRYVFLDWSDPFRCGSLLREGQWLDAGKFTNWQPDGCMLHNYAPSDISTCLSSRRVVFIGDSIARQLFFTVAHAADPDLPPEPPSDNQKHVDHDLVSRYHTKFSFIWDPFLNSTRTRTILQLKDGVNGSTSTPAMMVVGSGLWFLRYAESSGGPAQWEARIEDTLKLITEAGEQLADTVVFLPVENLISTKLSPARSLTMHNPDVDAMNADLRHRIDPPTAYSLFPSQWFQRSSRRRPWIVFPRAFNRMLDSSQTDDGLHFSNRILRAHANILLNFRCNEVQPKKFPLDKTCCRSYPSASSYQILFIVFLVSWGAIARFAAPHLSRNPRLQAFFPGEDHIMPLSIFGLAILLIFIADRTPIWLKEQKQYNPWVFGACMTFSLLTGLFAMKRADNDLGFLNREQTDEWKGWMQIAILIYHYFGASKVSAIYNPIRVLVASYLFMTGYGHTTFYIKKADFGLSRMTQVMVRLNILPITLAYTMNTDYLFYYFSPLVSMWFLIIYATMAIGNSYNDRTAFLAAKLLVSMGFITLVMSQDWILAELFVWLDRLCKIKWSAKEWAFRVRLDIWIVYVGMFTALAHIKFRELRLIDHTLWPLARRMSIGLSVVILFWFFIFELSQPSKFTYNAWHPYVSMLPIGSFFILRNANPILRSASSRVFAFIGTCSLETFIIQYHFWMAADTKGLLLIIPGTNWRPVNMLASTIMFIWLSHKVAIASGELTDWFCGTSRKKLLPTSVAPRAAGTPGNSNSFARTEEIPLMPPGKNGDPRPQQDDDGPHPVPSERWIDRLANGTATPSSSSAPGFRIFIGERSSWRSNWRPGIGTRLAVTGLILWFVNITWSS